MERLTAAPGVQAWCEARRKAGQRIGLVATMGAFHQGHLALMRRARTQCDIVVVYVFVNPLQFGPGEDLARYPRNLDRDRTLAEGVGADLLFTPTAVDMYPDGYPPRPDRLVQPGLAGERFEGASRPGHFAGMLTVVDRLFEIVGPCRAYFGEKDAQQLFLVREMAIVRHPGVTITPCPTVREEDGLAMSSRNVYLDSVNRSAATCLVRGLLEARHAFDAGVRDPSRLAAVLAGRIGEEPRALLDYAAVVDDATFDTPASPIPDGTTVRALVAARFGDTRLIDNMVLGP